MTHPYPDAPAGDVDTVRYDVESELNPRYAETGWPIDYYGIYRAIAYHADGTREVLYTGERGEGRDNAYRLAGRLSNEALERRLAAAGPGSADAGDNGGGG